MPPSSVDHRKLESDLEAEGQDAEWLRRPALLVTLVTQFCL